MKSEGNSNVTGHCWLMTATACEHSVIEAKVKVMWNCSIVVICNWFVSILCPLLSLLCHITNHIIILYIINFALHKKVVSSSTLHHKSHLLWEWLLPWKGLSWGTEVEGKGNCPYSMDEWNEWSSEEPFREKRDTTSINYSSLSWEGQRNDF